MLYEYVFGLEFRDNDGVDILGLLTEDPRPTRFWAAINRGEFRFGMHKSSLFILAIKARTVLDDPWAKLARAVRLMELDGADELVNVRLVGRQDADGQS